MPSAPCFIAFSSSGTSRTSERGHVRSAGRYAESLSISLDSPCASSSAAHCSTSELETVTSCTERGPAPIRSRRKGGGDDVALRVRKGSLARSVCQGDQGIPGQQAARSLSITDHVVDTYSPSTDSSSVTEWTQPANSIARIYWDDASIACPHVVSSGRP